MIEQWIDEICQVMMPNQIIKMLAPHISTGRVQKIQLVIDARLDSIHVAVEAPKNPHNAAAIVRTADGLGIIAMHVIAAENKALAAKGTTQGAYQWIHKYYHASLEDYVNEMIKQDKVIVGAAPEGEITLADVPIDKPLCILLGNEHRGLSPAAKRACTYLYRIPMLGMCQSYNLSVSGAMSLYEITGRKRRALSGNSELSEAERSQLFSRYYLYSVKSRFVEALLRECRAKHGITERG